MTDYVKRFPDTPKTPDGFEWVDCGNGKSVYRKIPEINRSRSHLPSPSFQTDTLDAPLYSGADGNQYTSKSALRASYKASNNPRGLEFVEVGNEVIPHKDKIDISDKAIDESLNKAFDRIS